MKIVTTTQVDVKQWDELAAALGGVYFHCHAQAAFAATLTGADPLFVKAIDDEGRCVGLTTGRLIIPFGWPFSRRCRSATLLALPATADKSVEAEFAFMEALEAHFRRQGVYLVNVFSYDSANVQQVIEPLGYELSPRTEFYIDLTQSEVEIWGGLKCERRTDIRKARKLGVDTRIENTQEGLESVFRFFEQSMQRHGIEFGEARERTQRARRERLDSGNIDVLVSYRSGTPVSGAVFGNFNGRPYYVVSGSSPEGYKCCGPAHLVWTAITTYRERGAIYLNLGAATEGQAGLYRFKRDFGAAPVPQPSGKKTLSTFGARLHQARVLLRRKRL